MIWLILAPLALAVIIDLSLRGVGWVGRRMFNSPPRSTARPDVDTTAPDPTAPGEAWRPDAGGDST